MKWCVWRRPSAIGYRLSAFRWPIADGRKPIADGRKPIAPVSSYSRNGPYLRTGDLGFFHNGELFITGRLKDLIILQGRNIYPNDVEQSLPAVHGAFAPHGSAAFAIDQENQEQLVIVQEVLRPARLDLDALAQDVRAMLLREHQVWLFGLAFIKGGTLAKTSSGKVQRFEVRRKYLAGELALLKQWTWDFRGAGDSPAVTPNQDTPAIQDWLVSHLARHYQLASDQIDVHQSIRSYVMDSVTLMVLALELETWLGRSRRWLFLTPHRSPNFRVALPTPPPPAWPLPSAASRPFHALMT